MLNMLDVAIGVTFFFLVLSLITTAAGEVVEALWKQRAKFLQRAIQGLLQDHTGTGLAREFYGHPLIKALYAGTPKWYKLNKQTLNDAPGGELERITGKPTYIPSTTFALALVGLLQEAATKEDDAPPTLRSSLDTLANDNNHPYGPLVKALRPLLNGVEDDVDAALKRIEAWYDAAMDRAAGWYKSHAQAVAFFFGLTVAVFMNADALYTVQSLSREEGLRSAFVAAAASAVEEARAASEAVGAAAPDTTATAAVDTAEEDLREARARLDANVERLEELGLQLGWSAENPGARWPRRTDAAAPAWHASLLDDPRWWLFKLLGLLLTATAVTLGAPFWFDVLNKFMVVRSTVKPTEKSPPEGSEDG